MNAADLLQKINEALVATATVRSVFGEPIQANGKTIVPVAKVAYGFGAGAGSGQDAGGPERQGEGGGAGGGMRATPAGVLEITEARTRFVPFADPRPLAAAFGAGVVLGALFFSHRRR